MTATTGTSRADASAPTPEDSPDATPNLGALAALSSLRTAAWLPPAGAMAAFADLGALAARNGWALTLFGDGVEGRHQLPSTVVHAEEHCTVRRYSAPDAGGAPILLVPPLAVSIDCYDLRPGQSLAAHFVETGRPVYVVDYGWIHYSDRNMGFEDWITGILPTAIDRVLDDHGLDDHGLDDLVPHDRAHRGHAETARHGSTPRAGEPSVDLVAWSLGGTLSLLTAADDPQLPIRSIVTIGTPVDYSQNPSIAPLRMLGSIAPVPVVGAAVRAVGGIPSSIVRLSYRSTAPGREITRPWFIARNLTNTDALAQMESIDRFMARMPGYPARFYTQMHKHLIMDNRLARGSVRFGGRKITLADLSVPVLAVAGTDDVLAPAASVEPTPDLLLGSPSARVVTVPGSHLGIVAGRRAAEQTWPVIDRFHAELDA